MKILVTGGAGFKGTLLTEALLQRGCKVTIFDNFMYGLEPVLGLARHHNCHVNKKDIRNITLKDVEGFDIIYHLAAISGYPACEANPHSAQTINVDSTKKMVDLLHDDQVLVYASTTSMYGKAGTEQDEMSPPAPESTYGVTKLAAERVCMQRQNSIAFRFATLFGTSLKMRCDLLPNDFAHKAVTERSIVLFDSNSVRTFLHVADGIRVYLMVLDQADKMVGEIYNAGSETMNFSKLQIAETIKKYTSVEIINSSLEDLDVRNFIIKFDKIKKLGFAPIISLDDGIKNLVNLYQWFRPYIPYQTI